MDDRKFQPLSVADFKLFAARLSGHSEKTIEALRLVLVHGRTATDAGKIVGLSKQAVGQALSRTMHIRYGVPSNWVRVDEYAPPEVAEAFYSALEEAKAKIPQ